MKNTKGVLAKKEHEIYLKIKEAEQNKRAYKGMRGKFKPMTLRDIAKEYNVTPEAIRLIKVKFSKKKNG